MPTQKELRMGYLAKGHLVNVTKSKEVLKRAMGDVLFIDEAYHLYRQENERDYGRETIEILLQVMENNRDDLVVVLAGYQDKMDTFFSSNPGMGARIAHHIDFPDYTLDELMGIACLILEEQQYSFSEEAEAAFREYVERRMKQPRFANGRSVRNALELARLRQATRIVEANSHKLTKADLMRIEAEDILASRVSDDDEGGVYESGGDDGDGSSREDEPDKAEVG